MVKCEVCGKKMFVNKTNEGLFVYKCCGNTFVSEYELDDERSVCC
jgi:hypothetical protein